MPNNRQWALFLWAAVLLAWILTQPRVRSSVLKVLDTIRSPKILVPLLLMATWVAGELWLGARVSLWKSGLAADSSIWFVGTALVLFGNFADAYEKPHFFRRKATSALGVAVLLQTYSELVVLALPVEIVMLPVLATTGGVSAFSAGKPEFVAAKRLVDVTLAVAGLVLVARVSIDLITSWAELDKGTLVRQVALPIWTTLLLLPFVYLVGVYGIYELTLLRVRWNAKLSMRAQLRAAWVLTTSFGLRARTLRAFAGLWPRELAEATTTSDARATVRRFQQQVEPTDPAPTKAH